MMFLPFFYRLFGYKPIRDTAQTERIVRGSRLEVRAAVNGLKRDVKALVNVAGETVLANRSTPHREGQ
jgi:hypothetical protein